MGIIRSGRRDMGNAYIERVTRVKNQIIARLRARLGMVRNANEMHWV